MKTSSVRGGDRAPGLGEAELGVQAGALEESAARLARDMNEALGANERRAEALDHRQQRLGQQWRRVAVGDRHELTVVVRPVCRPRARRRPHLEQPGAELGGRLVGGRKAGALGSRVAAGELAVQGHHRLRRRRDPAW